MIRHIELTIEDFELTCSGDKEDFERDSKEFIEEIILHYFYDEPMELIEKIKIKKIWYEED